MLIYTIQANQMGSLKQLILFLTQVQHHLTDPDGTLAILVNRHWLAIQIIHILQVLEVGVTMPTQHQVDVARTRNHLGIIVSIHIPT